MTKIFSGMDEQLILVDKSDMECGIADKLTIHREGLLHRAFSVFIFDSKKRLLLQRRSAQKYHSADLWSNACSGHPRRDEETIEAAKRRLSEEMGLRNLDLKPVFKFKYKARLQHNFIEHALDHVFIGITDSLPVINPDEAAGFQYLSPAEIEEKLKTEPETFTFWFRLAFEEVRKNINSY